MGRLIAIGVGAGVVVVVAAVLAESGVGVGPNVALAGPRTSAEAEALIRFHGCPTGPITQVKCRPARRKWHSDYRTPAGKMNSTEWVNGPDTGVFIVC